MNNIHPETHTRMQLPKVSQIAIVVQDIDKAMHAYAQLWGLRKWYRLAYADGGFVELRGKRIQNEIDIVMSYSGSLLIELIEHKGGDEDIFSEHLKQSGEGVHSVGFFVPDIDQRLKAMQTMGVGVLQYGVIKSRGGAVTTYAYLDPRGAGGILIELIQTRQFGVHLPASHFIMEIGCLTGDCQKIRV